MIYTFFLDKEGNRLYRVDTAQGEAWYSYQGQPWIKIKES